MSDKWFERSESDSLGWVRESHPSFGVVGISRASGNAHLFNSGVKHMHFITLTIREAERIVDGAEEHIHGGKQLINIWMSEAQFAQMITQPNHGDGVPCTIRDCQGDKDYPGERFGRPLPPEPEIFTKKYHEVLGERAARIGESLEKALKMANDLFEGNERPTKANLKSIQGALDSAIQNVKSNLPYVVEEVTEGIENRMSSAVTEFESYVAQSLQARGLQHLTESAPRLAGVEPKLLETS